MLGHKKTRHITARCALCLMLTGLLLMACDDATPAKTYSVGVVNYVATLTPVFEGFKARMAELGYVEGKNVTYIYHGTLAPDPQVIEREGDAPRVPGLPVQPQALLPQRRGLPVVALRIG